MADLIVGGGQYGERAALYLLGKGRQFVVVDPDPECPAAAGAGETCIAITGGPDAAFQAFMDYEPELVFPTAPVHVAAVLVCQADGFYEARDDVLGVLECFPRELVLGTRGGSVFISVNRHIPCIPECPSPDVCPVTGEDRSQPLYDRLRHLLPDACILESVQVAPGLGALRGSDLTALLEKCQGMQKVTLGTACRCHGVVTVLEADLEKSP